MKGTLVALLLSAASAQPGAKGTVRGSKHDLSVFGPGPIKADAETQVCVFCHVPHAASPRADFLSGRPDVGKSHMPYASSTARAHAGAPTGASRVCLSCHDGTIAVGQTLTKTYKMNAATADGKIPKNRRSNLGTDLRKTHPVSVSTPADRNLRAPPAAAAVHLDSDGKVQCTSCHDPHSEFGGAREGKFLLEPTARSAICITCHTLPADGSHSRSNRAFAAAQGNEDGYASVGDAGCMACHRSHGADVRGRLVRRGDTEPDDAVCLRCHAGTGSRVDIGRELAKQSAHSRSTGKHDPSEGPDDASHQLPEKSPSANRHVVCVDCHDPHAATDRDGAAPDAGGRLAGVWGIDAAGNRTAPATRQYEVCLKCHGDSANAPGSRPLAPRRAAAERNLRRVFDPSAPSNHPVMAAARNPLLPGLRAGTGLGRWTYCTDCHSSDDGPGAGGSGPRGPHGSIYQPLLERNYSTGDRATETPAAYALCYKCHDRDVLFSDRSGFSLKRCPPSRSGPACGALHKLHVVDAQAPCSVCHDAHGVAATTGTAANNAHLVDFDLNVVSIVAGTIRPYTSNGPGSGNCSLRCHDRTHRDAVY